MSLQSLVPILETPDINGTIAFYERILGFKTGSLWKDGEKIKGCSLQRDTISIMFSLPNGHINYGQALLTGVLYLRTDNVDEWYASLKDTSTLVYPLENFDYGMREFAIRDNNGYILSFGQPLETADDFHRYFPPAFTLETPRILMRPMQQGDEKMLAPIAADPAIWKYFTKDLSSPEAMKEWVEESLREKAIGKRMPFTVIEKDSGRVCGSTSYGNISFFDKRIEIGWTWLGTEFLGSGINQHAKYALLSYAFEVMKMERVEIKTDNLNERAKAALLKVGMIPEGILRNHMQMHSNRRRDTIYYSIIGSEWEERKHHFFYEIM